MSYLQSLTVFLAVADEGSFSGAAKKLGLTQPTVSFHIDNLEKNFGCLLFNRTTKGVSLTLYGKRLYESAGAVNKLIEQTKNQITAMTKGASGHLVIGASTIPNDYILPPVIASFLKAYPDITVSIRSGDSQTILAAFKKGELPLAIVGFCPDKELNAVPLWKDELVLVVHPDLASEFRPEKAGQLLRTVPIILRRECSGTRKTVMLALEKQNITLKQLKVVLEVDSNESLKAAILHKAGAGFISLWAVQAELLKSELVVLPNGIKETACSGGISNSSPMPAITRNFYALMDKSDTSPQPACVQVFFEYLLSACFKNGQMPTGGDF